MDGRSVKDLAKRLEQMAAQSPISAAEETDTITESNSIAESQAEDQEKPLVPADHPASRPPTPPEQGPPGNFGTVVKDTIYRSAFPSNANIDYLETLDIKTIITLTNFHYFTEEAPFTEIPDFVARNNINHLFIPVEPNKQKKKTGSYTTPESICEVLGYALNEENYPLYIHCNQGKHRTGTVVGCLRKCQSWPMEEIIAEYHTYAGLKPRDEDIEFIVNFDPSAVYEYAKKHGTMETWNRERADSVHSWQDMAMVLPGHSSGSSAYTGSDYDSAY